MSYGLEAKNQNGEIVIDTQYPILALSETQTVSYNAGPRDGPNSTTYYRYDGGVSTGELKFFNATNRLLFLDGYHIWTPNTSETVRIGKNIAELTLNNGYGFEVYDSSGSITYSAAVDLLSLQDKYSWDFDSNINGNGVGLYGTVSTSTPWICPQISRPILYQISIQLGFFFHAFTDHSGGTLGYGFSGSFLGPPYNSTIGATGAFLLAD